MEQVTATIYIPRAAAIASGYATHGEEIVPLSAAALASLSAEDRDEIKADKVLHTFYVLGRTQRAFASRPGLEGVLETCAKRREIRQQAEKEQAEILVAQNAEHAETLAKWLAQPDEDVIEPYDTYHDRVAMPYGGCYLSVQSWEEIGGEPFKAALARRAALVQARNAAKEETYQAKRAAAAAKDAAREVEEAAREAQKENAIRIWAMEYAKERYEAGYLDREEALAGIRALAEYSLRQAGFKLYDPITAEDIIHCDTCDRPNTEFRSESCKTLTAEQFEALKALRKASGDATATVQRNRGYCRLDECTEIVERYSVKLYLSWNGLDVETEFALKP